MSRHDNMNAHSNTTIWSLLKDIFKLIITIGNLGISYIEDWLKVLLKMAISKENPTELEESIKRAEYFIDEYGDEYEIEIQESWNGGETNTSTTNGNKAPIYDGVYDDDRE